MELPKHYDPQTVEPRLYEHWERNGYFHEEPDPARPPFIICMPPPNVTGRAHLGHGSTFTPMDVLTRYHRMLGNNADWLPGVDHAAIATEAVLVKQLAQKGLRREDLGREGFVAHAWEWSRTYGGQIDAQFRRLGFGPDWERSRFTMDEGLSAAVRRVFVQLYREGLIYRGTRLVNWDPTAQTTVSDAELEYVERDGTLWRIRYPFSKEDRSDGIEIATTRPETMLGDVAIAVHPQDPRYSNIVGRSVWLPPLFERAIPIVADEAVDMEFGTGAVKVTPAHDQADYEIGVRHALEMPSVIGLDARIAGTDVNVGPYAGLDRFEARERIVADLERCGVLLEAQPHRHSVATSDRSGDVTEPLLSLQWFVKMAPLAKPALGAYRDGRLRFVPERHGRTYERWLENIRDWNVSRQIWWGHRLPVWYTPDGREVVAESEDEALELARATYGTSEITRDPDTLDTWFSSGIWPFSILGWPGRNGGAALLVPVANDDYRRRDPLSLGGADGDAGAALHGPRSIPRRRHHAVGLRCRRAQDVEVARQHHRSDGASGEVWRGRISALDPSADASREPGGSLSRVALRRGTQLQQQDLECNAVHACAARRFALGNDPAGAEAH